MAKIKVRARAVDMLGRQQIAGIPTAIHELFKNAHDAYAERVEVDFIREDRLLILRDNGHGMTRDELENRWLTLGTETKIGANRENADWPGFLGLPRRPVMGEKGIGRLAIAVIGPQVLVVTRAIKETGLINPVACLVNWRLFEVPGLDIDEIEVPIINIEQGAYPDQNDLYALADKIRANLRRLGDRVPPEYRKKILNDLQYTAFDPGEFLDYVQEAEEQPGPDVRGQGHGTHFFVMPTSSSLVDDIDEEETDVATPLKKNLLGFSNTMIPKTDEPPIKALFRDHLPDGRINELIAQDNFLTPDEFASADHHFDGAFDAYGQFKGTLQLYGEVPIEYTLAWDKANGRETECGPFRVRIAHVQGLADETRMPPDAWHQLTKKLDLIGGLYIYRDGVRILPYGNSDFDFLHIERRRSKAAKDWFFSYRRIFGAVEISYANNPELQEKAGREGFRSNTAYRQFRDILEHFVKRLAMDFFRESSERGDEYRQIKAELQERDRLLKKKAELAKEKKKAFVTNLDTFFGHIEAGNPARQAESIRQDYRTRLENIRQLDNPELSGKEILALEKSFGTRVAKLRKEFTLTRPRGLGLNKKLAADWDAYRKNSARLEETVYAPLRSDIEQAIESIVASNQATVDRHERVYGLFDAAAARHKREVKRLRSGAKDSKADLGKAVETTARASFEQVRTGLDNLEAEMRSVNFAAMSEEGFERYRTGILHRLDGLAKPEKAKLDRLRDQLDAVTTAIRQGESIVEMADAAEDATLAMREELAGYTEFAQTGMALGIIQHEFSSTVKSVREAIRQLKPWAAGTPELADVHKNLRGSFDHLDGYLRLFTPLSRRLYRSEVDLSGEEIRRYLGEIFGERLKRHGIRLQATPDFDQFVVRGYPSTFLPVFINLVDNAIYWIGFDRDSETWIQLDVDGEGFLVSNGGPGIAAKDADRIFEFGESNKIGGRGMGLFISRQALTKEGWDITLETTGQNVPPRFRIAPLDQEQEEP